MCLEKTRGISLAEYMTSKYGEDYFFKRWSDKNTINPYEITRGNCEIKVWIICENNPKHIYEQYVASFSKGIGCPYCNGKLVLREESLGVLHPEIFDIWSDKNQYTPYDYSEHSGKYVWIKCPNGIHEDYKASINNIVKSGCVCTKCNKYSSGYPIDLTGLRFGRLLVIKQDFETGKMLSGKYAKKQRWWCLCDCQCNLEKPQLKSIAREHLVSHSVVSCGCYIHEMCTGENNWNWKGGTSSESDKLRQTIEYRQWQKAVLKRDNYTCQCCGKRYKDLVTHHIFPFSDYKDLRTNLNNGICLCKNCHDSHIKGSFHNIYWTVHNTPDQLREYILNKSGKDIYQTHPEILHLISTQQNDYT